MADPDGLLAIGGDLSVDRLLLAYRSGIFPWYEGEHILWWTPDPRFVLFPTAIRTRKSVQKLIDENYYQFTINKAFTTVIRECKQARRTGQDGTWITDEVEKAYGRLYELGFAHSAEVWKDGELMGGLYGIRMGKVFFGESMFSRVPGASRYAFIRYIQQLKAEDVELVDCQVYTEYLESMGAQQIPRTVFMELLEKWL